MDAEKLWLALCEVCGSTRPVDEIKTLVTVKRSDIRAALKLLEADNDSVDKVARR